jgi:hypothetical protein
MAKPIWIIDDITVNPGQGPAFVDAYMKQYAPGGSVPEWRPEGRHRRGVAAFRGFRTRDR